MMFAFLFSAVLGFVSAAKTPHILFILADDYGWNDVGYHQSKETTNHAIKTPNLDRLASESCKLDNYYVQPLCSPTRGTIMTGRYPSHTGVGPDVIRPSHPYAMPKAEVMTPKVLKTAGYSTHAIGKWHLGLCDDRYTPTFRGFDSYTGYLLGAEDYFDHTRSDDGETGFDFRRSSNVTGMSDILPSPDKSATGTYSAYIWPTEVQRILDAEVGSGKPIYIYLPFQSVHAPLQAPQKYIDMYPADMEKSRRTYAGMVSAMDEQIGVIEEMYKKAGIWDDTVLIFSTDNGGPLKSANNFPLRGHKATAWEGGVRGVGFVRGTDSALAPVPAGTTTRALMHSTDWLPTIAGLAGASIDGLNLDGHDQWKAIAKGENSSRTFIIHNCPGANETDTGGALRMGNYKLMITSVAMQVGGDMVQTPPPGFKPSKSSVCPPPKDHQGMWLFDIDADPRECTNLASTKPDVLNQMLNFFKDYKQSAVPDLSIGQKKDPRSNPAHLDGSWGPWGCPYN